MTVQHACLRSYCVISALQDAADRKRMGRSTFKNLNLSLAAIATGNASSLW